MAESVIPNLEGKAVRCSGKVGSYKELLFIEFTDGTYLIETVHGLSSDERMNTFVPLKKGRKYQASEEGSVFTFMGVGSYHNEFYCVMQPEEGLLRVEPLYRIKEYKEISDNPRGKG